MIGSLRGTVLDRSVGGEVLVEVGGVGYRVAVPSGAVGVLEPGGPVFLFTHLVVREDALSLYGFPDREQRDTFEALMSATGTPSSAESFFRSRLPSRARRSSAIFRMIRVGNPSARIGAANIRWRERLVESSTSSTASGLGVPARLP